ncbi:hypothetical protein INR49_000397 [Caranx melampygus]|nr:hypothetical protein INR49_000397 [Caranx melampygus]
MLHQQYKDQAYHLFPQLLAFGAPGLASQANRDRVRETTSKDVAVRAMVAATVTPLTPIPPTVPLGLSPTSLRSDPALINAISFPQNNTNREMEALITHPRARYPDSALSVSWLFTDSAIVIQLGGRT